MRYASINFQLVPEPEAVVPIADVDYLYGYGVYETLKVRRSLVYFPEFHVNRLLESAGIVGIAHNLEGAAISRAFDELVAANGAQAADCNLKVVLIGRSGRPADLYIQCLAPLFPDKKELKQGTTAILFHGERHFPAAKSLSMLLSTIAFRKAAAQGAYDALLVNKRGEITEGTRTNIFWFRHSSTGDLPGTLHTPPEHTVLNGITRRTIMQCAREAGIKVDERPLRAEDLSGGGLSLFVSSTSTRILGVRRLLVPADESPHAEFTQELELEVGSQLRNLQALYKDWQEDWAARHEPGRYR